MTVPVLSHSEKEKQVFDFFNYIVEQEINVINVKNDKSVDLVPSRIQLIIIFSLVDIMSNYWYEFRGASAGNKVKFCEWVNTFCLTKNNKKYIAYWKKVSAERLYSLRCSVVHFFGISEPSEGIYFAISPNDYPESKRGEFSRKVSKPGNKTIMLKTKHLHELVREGGILMLASWMRIIKQASKGDPTRRRAYVTGIDRVWAKYWREGAVHVNLGPRPANFNS
jgi:hypothetical protein